MQSWHYDDKYIRNDIWSIKFSLLCNTVCSWFNSKYIYAHNVNILFILIGSYSQNDVDDFLVESLKMKQLNHFNVMTLEGVCLDAGSAPFIVLPYMAGMCK